MELLDTGRFDGFYLVSSDSDFTRLAARIRESGLTVYGFGERKTPKPFVAACDTFTYTENLAYTPGSPVPPRTVPRPAQAASKLQDAGPLESLRNAVDAASTDDGWSPLAHVGNILRKRQPDFDPRSWGHDKLTGLVEATGAFEVQKRDAGGGNPAIVYVRPHPAPTPADAHSPLRGTGTVRGRPAP